MSDFILTTVAFIVTLGILVFFHELGHFSVAKALGMKVDEFAFGFGPKLINLGKRKETEYSIRAFPLGGFVRLPGMEPGEESTPDGFNSQPIWRRAAVIFAGPFASFVLGFVIFSLYGTMIGFPKPDAKVTPVVDIVQPGWPADRVGLRSGDRILEISGKKIDSGPQVLDIVHNSPGKPLDMVIRRGDKTLNITATPAPQPTVQISDPKTSLAHKSGLKDYDRYVEVDGKKIKDGKQVLAFADRDIQKINVKVERVVDGKEKIVSASVPPEALREVNGLLGFLPRIPKEKAGVFESIKIGVLNTYGYLVEFASLFVDGDKLSDSVGGVVAIARITEKTAQAGIGPLMLQTGSLSLGLAIINLFPLPILDGGHLLFLAIEKLRRGKKPTAESMAIVQSFGLALIIGLMILLVYRDIAKWISGTPLQ